MYPIHYFERNVMFKNKKVVIISLVCFLTILAFVNANEGKTVPLSAEFQQPASYNFDNSGLLIAQRRGGGGRARGGGGGRARTRGTRSNVRSSGSYRSRSRNSSTRSRSGNRGGYMSSGSNFSRPSVKTRSRSSQTRPSGNIKNRRDYNHSNVRNRNNQGGYMIPSNRSKTGHPKINMGNLNSNTMQNLRNKGTGASTRPARPSQLPSNIQRPVSGNRPNRPDAGNRPNRPDRPNYENRPNRPDYSNRPNRPDRPNYGNRPDRPYYGNRPGYVHPSRPYYRPPYPRHLPAYHYHHYHRGPYYRGYWHGYHYRYPWGVALTTALVTLPATAIAIAATSQPDVKYYYNEGVYYVNQGGQYKVTEPPQGAVVESLPDGMMPITVGASKYYYYFGAFYLQDKDGKYMVVDPPVGATVPYVPEGAQELEFDDGTVLIQAFNAYYLPTEDGANTVFKVVDPAMY